MLGVGFGLTGGDALRLRADQFAANAAPVGFKWDFVTLDGAVVTVDGEPVVTRIEGYHG